MPEIGHGGAEATVVTVRNGVVPAVVPGAAARSRSGDLPVPARRPLSTGGVDASDGRPLKPRQVDLRRTPAPRPVELPSMRSPHPRRYAMAVFDHRGRLTCGMLFDVLDWEAGTPVDISVRRGDRRASHRGGRVRVERSAISAYSGPSQRWCSFGEREPVLVRAVPESATLLILRSGVAGPGAAGPGRSGSCRRR